MIGISLGIKLKSEKVTSSTPSATSPSNTVAPSVTGSFVVGQVLTTTNGTWEGTESITFTYQWQRNTSNISGATASTYTLTQDDADFEVECVVTATNVAGSASANSNSGYVFDADYQAIINEATTLSYTLPTSGQRVKQNKLMIALKAEGIFSRLDIMYIFANDGSQEFATLNWKDPSAFQANLINAPTFTSNEGFNSDGATSYIRTSWTPSINSQEMTLNSVHRSLYNYTFRAGSRGNIIGAFSGTVDRTAFSSNNNVVRLNVSSSNLSPTIDNRAEGFHVYNRLNDSDVRILVDGVFSNHTSAVGALATSNRTLFYSGIISTASDITISTYSEGGKLNDTESLAFQDAVNTYMGTL
jgi:hypothetical protein